MIYIAMIRSFIDYGYMTYGSAVSTVIKDLDIVHAKALRICSGAFRTTQIPVDRSGRDVPGNYTI